MRALVLNRIKHPRVALAVHGAAAIALVPAFVWLAPPSQWDKPGLLMVLLALAVISYVTEITLPNGLSFDAALELVLITLVLMGPLPAFLVAVVLFALGSLFSLFEGYEKLRAPHPIESPAWALGVLVFAVVLEGLSLRTARPGRSGDRACSATSGTRGGPKGRWSSWRTPPPRSG